VRSLYLSPCIPQFWAHFLPRVLYGRLFEFFDSLCDQRSPILGIKRSTWTSLLATLCSEVLVHPLRVAQLHHVLLGSEVGGCISTLDALVELTKYGLTYWWTGFAAAILRETVGVFLLGEITPRVFAKLGTMYPWEVRHPLVHGALFALIMTPFQVVSTQAMSQTPLLLQSRSPTLITTYPPSILDHFAMLWHRDGIGGFYKGAPFTFLQHFLLLGSRTILLTWFKSSRYAERENLETIAFGSWTATAASFVLSWLLSTKFPYET